MDEFEFNEDEDDMFAAALEAVALEGGEALEAEGEEEEEDEESAASESSEEESEEDEEEEEGSDSASEAEDKVVR
jgi:hypothetical protein